DQVQNLVRMIAQAAAQDLFCDPHGQRDQGLADRLFQGVQGLLAGLGQGVQAAGLVARGLGAFVVPRAQAQRTALALAFLAPLAAAFLKALGQAFGVAFAAPLLESGLVSLAFALFAGLRQGLGALAQPIGLVLVGRVAAGRRRRAARGG